MGEDLERLKQSLPLLEYLRRHNRNAHPAGTAQEFVGLCPLHRETRPSFYMNARKNLFYCHGCGRGGDLIRFIELFHNLSFRQSISLLRQELIPDTYSQLLDHVHAFYRLQLHRYPEAVRYLEQRGCVIPPASRNWARLCSRRKPAPPSDALWRLVRSALQNRFYQ
jgi:DNA primase